MKSKLIFLGDTEYRLMAVGAYSFTVMPLLASGLALDFYCFGRPRMAWLAAILCMVIGALIAISANSLGAVLASIRRKLPST